MEPEQEITPLGRAIAVVSQLIVVALMMFLPAVAGSWLDKWLRTSFFGILCLAVGVVGGFYQLLQLTRTLANQQNKRSK